MTQILDLAAKPFSTLINNSMNSRKDRQCRRKDGHFDMYNWNL